MVEVASHARHDRLAVAAALSGGAQPSTLTTCPACGALHRDLLSIQSAIRHAWTPRRARDLRLRRDDVALRQGASRRRMLDVMTRRLAIGLTALGIAGLVVASVPLSPGLAGTTAAPGAIVTYGAPAASGAPIGERIDAASSAPDPLILVSGVSLGAGGTMLGLRHLAARRRAMR